MLQKYPDDVRHLNVALSYTFIVFKQEQKKNTTLARTIWLLNISVPPVDNRLTSSQKFMTCNLIIITIIEALISYAISLENILSRPRHKYKIVDKPFRVMTNNKSIEICNN